MKVRREEKKEKGEGRGRMAEEIRETETEQRT